MREEYVMRDAARDTCALVSDDAVLSRSSLTAELRFASTIGKEKK
jgi:hypothetical protein